MMKRSFIAAALLAACHTAPAQPAWQADVEPVVASNCVRCHGSPALYGAPASFRLDIDHDVRNPFTGDVTHGAGTMAAFMKARVDDGSMPPVFPLVGDAPDVIANWSPVQTDHEPAARAARGDARPGNHAPTITLTATGNASFDYEIDDADRDLVYGELYVGAKPVAIDLHAGRGSVVLNTADLPDGTYPLIAKLDDGAEPPGDLGITAGQVTVTGHGADPIAVSVLAPTRYDIVAPVDPQPVIQLCADGGTPPLTAAIVAFDPRTPNDKINLGQVTTVASCTATTPSGVAWDVSALPPGDRYIVRVVVSDGTHTPRTVNVPVTIGAPATTTTDTFATISSNDVNILAGCTNCHGTCSAVPGLNLDWSSYQGQPADPANVDHDCLPTVGVRPSRGLIYDRVVRYKDMPPISAVLLDTGFTLDDAQRERLAKYLLAGAPP